ncbi:hypothetical protein [Sphingobacterium paucimobilis]|uniref:Uncharacterized protein n=1 Tax=Sphingobacterium paucimobilis HER1398 TaxID=1346330 RepID=U2HHT8_9SPHI|nr:hypothetical protein [Sphingobacterium paucimobilis]ERJ61321.1 hypothetical protein M472_21435 [Sphingobacterium paucimobilis HER1398]
MKVHTSDSTSELSLDLMFIATDTVDLKVFLDDDPLFATYLGNETGIESSYTENQDNLILLLEFIFNTKVTLTELTESANRKVYDLTFYKDRCISIEDLERNYLIWIEESGHDNNMDEYGNLVSIIGYIRRNQGKKHLLLTVEKRTP